MPFAGVVQGLQEEFSDDFISLSTLTKHVKNTYIWKERPAQNPASDKCVCNFDSVNYVSEP